MSGEDLGGTTPERIAGVEISGMRFNTSMTLMAGDDERAALLAMTRAGEALGMQKEGGVVSDSGRAMTFAQEGTYIETRLTEKDGYAITIQNSALAESGKLRQKIELTTGLPAILAGLEVTLRMADSEQVLHFLETMPDVYVTELMNAKACDMDFPGLLESLRRIGTDHLPEEQPIIWRAIHGAVRATGHSEAEPVVAQLGSIAQYAGDQLALAQSAAGAIGSLQEFSTQELTASQRMSLSQQLARILPHDYQCVKASNEWWALDLPPTGSPPLDAKFSLMCSGVGLYDRVKQIFYPEAFDPGLTLVVEPGRVTTHPKDKHAAAAIQAQMSRYLSSHPDFKRILKTLGTK